MFESSGKLDSPSPDSGLPVPGTYNHALPIFVHTRGSLIVEARLKSPAIPPYANGASPVPWP